MALIHDVAAAFELFQPVTIDDTLALLDRYKKDAWVMAGGLDTFDWLKDRIKRPAVIVDMRQHQVAQRDHQREKGRRGDEHRPGGDAVGPQRAALQEGKTVVKEHGGRRAVGTEESDTVRLRYAGANKIHRTGCIRRPPGRMRQGIGALAIEARAF